MSSRPLTRAIAVLAAGQSTRFGVENKLLAMLGDRPLAGHVADAVRQTPADHRLAVVTDRAVAALFHGFDILWLEAAGDQSASLRAAALRAEALDVDQLIVTLGDMPLVPRTAYEQVAALAQDDQASAVTDGQRPMPPACFPRAMFTQLAALDGDKGARSLLRALPDRALVPIDPARLQDIDRKSDLTALGIAQTRNL